MSFCQAYLNEFDYEAISTRKMLERAPTEKFDWVPHEKSTKLGSLVNHIAGLPLLSTIVLSFDEYDVRSPESIAARPTPSTITPELLARWDKNMEQMRATVAATSEEQLADTFTLKAGPKTIFSVPRKLALRTFILNHLIHHRGQLAVYLRLLDIPVPSIYGPSADEQ